MAVEISAEDATQATRELLEYFKRGIGEPPGWYAAITIAKELQIPPWEVLGEAREDRPWSALAIGAICANRDYVEWANKRIRRH